MRIKSGSKISAVFKVVIVGTWGPVRVSSSSCSERALQYYFVFIGVYFLVGFDKKQ
jgi:hypothetical protein